ncbi:MAG TPA: 50S ribosomal protein L18 [Gammaproteobacteria bacterium]|nr:50S ribosomal protein L18 [Gammaproteobacteria bacterium]
MNSKTIKRFRRAKRSREHIKKLALEKGIARLSIYRSSSHIYAQILAPIGGKVLAHASSLEKDIKAEKNAEGGKIGVAQNVGKLIAKRAQEAGIERVACDRSGYRYHGRVAALVEAARETGLVV